MDRCPFHTAALAQPVPPGIGAPDEYAFLAEAHGGKIPPERLAACVAAVEAGRPAPLDADELRWAGRVAWRNHARCIGRLHWRSLEVRDRREVTEPARIAEALREHLLAAQGDGTVRSLLTVFAPAERAGGPAPRIWNGQLCAYAGYRGAGGAILGDPKNVVLTDHALELGWRPPAVRGRFDLLPWIIAGLDGQSQLFPLEVGLVREVVLSHPEFPWFEQLGLRWYAVPVIADMCFHAAATDYPAAPFNGWYMGTEIGARNLADADRYNLLPVVAERMGLDRRSARTLWQDRALLTLNEAVLHSYAAAGVKLVDHHAASAEFMKFCEREQTAGRDVSARWDWIVPPMSPATTPVFHLPMQEFATTPDFHYQPPAWARAG
jgi:nitric-oxide synthase